MNVPCVYLGQNSSQLYNELNKISSTLTSNNVTAGSKSSVVDQGFYNTKFNSSIILDDLMKVLERLDTINCVHFICDLGIAHSSAILQDMADDLPGVSLRSLYISPIDKLHSINTINSIINLETSLSISDAIMLRGFDDIHQLMTASLVNESNDNEGNIQSYLSYMAADIFVAFCNKRSSGHDDDSNKCWPINVCSANKKIYDVRSSLWRYLRMSNKKSEYNALRAMATNLHSLHTCIDPKPNFKFDNIASADLLNVHYDRNNCFYSSNKSNANDIKVALDWATPHVHWPILGSNNTGSKKADNVNNVSSSSSVTSELSRNTIFSSASVRVDNTTNVRVDNTTSNSTRKEISALSFQSQYATAAISNICQKTKALLDIGAFNHSFCGYDNDDAHDALEYVCEYIDVNY